MIIDRCDEEAMLNEPLSAKESEYINSLSHDAFREACLTEWRERGRDLTDNMVSEILETYNNEAIACLIAKAYADGLLGEE